MRHRQNGRRTDSQIDGQIKIDEHCLPSVIEGGSNYFKSGCGVMSVMQCIRNLCWNNYFSIIVVVFQEWFQRDFYNEIQSQTLLK